MKPDRELQQHVLDALAFEPALDAARVGVSVREGVVTLNGVVSTALERQRAEDVAQHVHGVRGLANDLLVQVDPAVKRTDGAIADAAVAALAWHPEVPAESVHVSVADGWVTLTGSVEWAFQRNAAEFAMLHLAGVHGVHNGLVISPRVRPHDVTMKIEDAFRRSAEIEAARLRVETSQHGDVTLRGSVRTWSERLEAERAAWAAPGVVRVDNRLTVAPATPVPVH